jgi:molybdopterin synthase catalytic subunit
MTAFIDITDKPLDIDQAVSQCQSPRSGAICVFVGTTRQYTTGQRTTGQRTTGQHTERTPSCSVVETEYLEYEAHREMALEQLRKLVDETCLQWALNSCVAIHRIGRVNLCEPSIVVAVSAPHRRAAFEACETLVDRIKKEVPIWKREFYKNQPPEWVHPVDAS